jgi:MFS family permease
MTTALGPVIGGWLIEHVSWRAVFFLNLPLALAVLLLVARYVPESRNEEESKQLDLAGAALATLSLGAIVYGLIESSRLGLQSPVVIVVLSAGVILFALFILVEARVRHPMMPLTLFRSRNFAGANLVTLFLYASLAGTLYFMPLNLIQVQGYTATAAGAAMLPFILIMFLLSRWSGGLVKRYGARLPLVVGPIIAAIGFALFLRPGVGGSYFRTFFPAIVVLGLGMAISVAPLTTTVMNSVTDSHAGIASGVNNAVSRTAGLLAVAVFGLIMFHAFDRCIEQRLNLIPITADARHALSAERLKLAAADIPQNINEETRVAIRLAIDECFVFGFRGVMLVGAGLSLTGSALAWLTIRSE